MTTYRFVPCRRTDEGLGPHLTVDASFLVLTYAGPSTAMIALAEVTPYDHETEIEDGEPVSEELETLLFSAAAYPPAMAVMKHVAEDAFKDRAVGVQELEPTLIRLITLMLEHQPDHAFVLARSRIDELGYRRKGEFVWLLNYDQNDGSVTWVSCDYETYSDPVDTFDTDDRALRRIDSRLSPVIDSLYDAI